MKPEIFLRQYEYSIFPSMFVMASMDAKQHHHFPGNKPLAEVKLDFEKGTFLLEADWQFIIASNNHAEQSWYGCHKERIKVEASICPSQVINLADECNDGFVFALDGSLIDGDNISFCSGLLVLDNIKMKNGTMTNEWSLTFYIYDALNDDCEIRLKLPLHIVTTKGTLN
jgi:hypothetical protein